MMKLTQVAGIFMISAFSLFIIGCNNSEQEGTKNNTEKTVVAPENLVVVDYAIEGMVCAMGCAKTIQDEVADMAGVVACSVDFEEGKAHIEFDKSQLTEEDLITKIESIADGQYKVTVWEEEDIEEDSTLEEGNSKNEKSAIKVMLPSFHLPNLSSFFYR